MTFALALVCLQVRSTDLAQSFGNLAMMKRGQTVGWDKGSRSRLITRVLAGTCLFVSACAYGESPQAEVTAVEHSVTKDSVQVVVRFNTAVRYVPGTATDPFRLYFDLRGTRPAATLAASSTVGDVLVQRVRLGQYQAGITRIVLDMTRPAPYTTTFLTNPPRLLIEVMRDGATPSNGRHAAASSMPAPASPSAPVAPEQIPPVPPQVNYRNGLLTITASNSLLSDVLQAVAVRINATLEAPPPLTGQRVAVVLGPAPPREVLAAMLQGMDYVLVGSSNDPEGIREIILRPGNSGPAGSPAAPPAAAQAETSQERTPPDTASNQAPPAADQRSPAKTPEELLEELRRLEEQQPNPQAR